MAFDLNVYGTRHTVDDVDPQTPLLWVIRDHIGLKGTKFSCGIGQCGACTLHIDGQAVRSCSIPANMAVGTIGDIKSLGDGKGVTSPHNRVIRWSVLEAPGTSFLTAV